MSQSTSRLNPKYYLILSSHRPLVIFNAHHQQPYAIIIFAVFHRRFKSSNVRGDEHSCTASGRCTQSLCRRAMRHFEIRKKKNDDAIPILRGRIYQQQNRILYSQRFAVLLMRLLSSSGGAYFIRKKQILNKITYCRYHGMFKNIINAGH